VDEPAANFDGAQRGWKGKARSPGRIARLGAGLGLPIATQTTPQRLGAGFSAGSGSFCRIVVQLGSTREDAKSGHVSALRVRAFRCDRFGRILSPAHKATSHAPTARPSMRRVLAPGKLEIDAEEACVRLRRVRNSHRLSLVEWREGRQRD
jgi:hypothetical protein